MAGILRHKPSLKVGIYGSYYPRSEPRRLESLRDSLRRGGYSRSYLVKDLPDLPEFTDSFDKSSFSMAMSNVNIFVLTFGGQKQGVVRELDCVLRNPELVYKCVALIESVGTGKRRRRCLTSLLDGDLRTIGMRVVEFDKRDDVELLEMVNGVLLDSLYYYVRNRPRDLELKG